MNVFSADAGEALGQRDGLAGADGLHIRVNRPSTAACTISLRMTTWPRVWKICMLL